jgi:hypothetical protein
MIDCPNAEIRDQLPELVNGRLAGDALLVVRAHVVDCSPCQAEVLLLERTRAMLILATPRVDTAAIAQALPAPRVQLRSRAFDWRIAATIALLAVGGGGTAVMYSNRTSPRLTDTIALGIGAPVSSVAISDGSELSISSDLSDLSDEQLGALVGSVDGIEALPAADVRAPSQLGGVVPGVGRDSTGAR